MKTNLLVQHYIAQVGGRAEAARRLGITVGMVGHLAVGRRKVSPRIARRIEAETNGAIRRDALCPQVFGEAA